MSTWYYTVDSNTYGKCFIFNLKEYKHLLILRRLLLEAKGLEW